MATSDQLAKSEATTRAALAIISAEANAREKKTARLREARLATEVKVRKTKRES